MSQKQDRINDVLTERISQLEGELRTTKDRLFTALGQKENLEKEVALIREEAHDVVGQWENEATELRRKLIAAEEGQISAVAFLKERDDTISSLKTELQTAQEMCSKHSTAIQQAKEKEDETQQEVKKLKEDLALAHNDLAFSTTQLEEFGKLNFKYQDEMRELLSSKKRDTQALDEMRYFLSQAQAENKLLRTASKDVSSNAERLLSCIEELKREKEHFEAQIRVLSDECAAYMREKDTTSSQLVDMLKANEDLRQKNNELREEVTKSLGSLKATESASIQQLDIITSLEKDILDLKSHDVMSVKRITDLEHELGNAKMQADSFQQLKEDLETELETVKEYYSTTLMELNDSRHKGAVAASDMKTEIQRCRDDATNRLALAEEEYASALSSMRQLTSAMHSIQMSDFFKQESLSRQSIDIEQCIVFQSVYERCFSIFHQRYYSLSTSLSNAENATFRVAEKLKDANSQLDAVLTRCRASEQTLTEQKRLYSSLEGSMSATSAQLTSCATERDALLRDNAWLKQQMESMRQELGELDEILSANLNEMREENERLQIENERLQKKVLSYSENEGRLNQQVQGSEEQLSSLQMELGALVKTLEITEAELLASKARIDSLSTSLQCTQQKFEESESRAVGLASKEKALSSQIRDLHEQLDIRESKLSLAFSERRKENESAVHKMNTLVEQNERCTEQLNAEVKARKDMERTFASTKEQNSKLRSALDELKSRCAADAAALKQLLLGRDELMRERDVIVEKYNKLHDAFRNMRKEMSGKAVEEVRRLLELSTSQETELQILRQQNIVLKKSVSMFAESAQPKAEVIFMERLNQAEGPIRHPKRRTTTSTVESTASKK